MVQKKKKKPFKQVFVTFHGLGKGVFRFFVNRRELSFVLLLTIISAAMQISFSLSTWGTIHPDEIFQSLEIAHDIVYGYGTIPPEFQESNPVIPSYAKSRSFLFPIIFTVPMYLGKLFGWNYWRFTIPLIRILLGINGSLLAPSTYVLVKRYTKGKKAFASASAFIIAFSPLLMFSSFRSVSNIFFVPWFFFIINSFWKTLENLQKENGDESQRKLKMSRSFRSYLKIIVLIATLVFKFPYKKIKVIACNFLGLGLAALFGGLVDFITYGDFLISPIQWFRYNVLEGLSSIHGVEPVTFYLDSLFSYIPLIIFLVFCALVVLGTLVYTTCKYIKCKEKNWILLRNICGFPTASMIIIALFSIPSHKEFRFVYLGFIYLHVSLAISISLLFQVFSPKISAYSAKLFTKIAKKTETAKISRIFNITFLTLVLLLIVSGGAISSYQGSQMYDWKAYDSLARSLWYVGQKDDSNGVLLFTQGSLMKSYFYLHKDIPLDELVNFWESFQIRKTIKDYAKENETFNYVIFSIYQIAETPYIVDALNDYNYVLNHSINEIAFIYKYNQTT
ncbi:MAG: hypothetical protein ACTSO5_13605 [Candidatus Heimdallarchaeaceae archaeon]